MVAIAAAARALQVVSNPAVQKAAVGTAKFVVTYVATDAALEVGKRAWKWQKDRREEVLNEQPPGSTSETVHTTPDGVTTKVKVEQPPSSVKVEVKMPLKQRIKDTATKAWRGIKYLVTFALRSVCRLVATIGYIVYFMAMGVLSVLQAVVGTLLGAVLYGVVRIATFRKNVEKSKYYARKAQVRGYSPFIFLKKVLDATLERAANWFWEHGFTEDAPVWPGRETAQHARRTAEAPKVDEPTPEPQDSSTPYPDEQRYEMPRFAQVNIPRSAKQNPMKFGHELYRELSRKLTEQELYAFRHEYLRNLLVDERMSPRQVERIIAGWDEEVHRTSKASASI